VQTLHYFEQISAFFLAEKIYPLEIDEENPQLEISLTDKPAA